MRLVPVEQSELTLPELLEMARTETVILTRNGKPLAAVKDLAGSDWESVSLANSPRFLAVIEAAHQDYREKGGIGLNELRRELQGTRTTPRRRRARKSPCDGTVRVLHETLYLAGQGGMIHSLDFSREGRMLASAGHDGTIRFWQVPTLPAAPADGAR